MTRHSKTPDPFLALARLARETEVSDPHPVLDEISAYIQERLDEAAAGRVRAHLIFCDDCAAIVDAAADAVHELEETGSRRDSKPKPQEQVEWLIERFVRLAAPESYAPALAAAPSSHAAPFEAFEAGDLRLVLVLTDDREVVATLTKRGEPAARVAVTLLRTAVAGEHTLIAHGSTDIEGRVSFGPVAAFPLPGLGEWYEIHLPRAGAPDA